MVRLAAEQREALTSTRRTQILEAALRLWAEHGTDRTTMEALAREVGVAKGTLYLYFPTKDALLAELVRNYSLLPDLERVFSALRDEPPARVIPLLVRTAWDGLRARRDLVRVFIRELPLHPEAGPLFTGSAVAPASSLLAEYMQVWAARGALRPVDGAIAARALLGMIVSFFLTQEVLGKGVFEPLSDERIVATLSALALGMLGVRDREATP
jgi:AcrR family transcriptional regulator